MKISEKVVRDGVSLIASYHFLLALASLIGASAIVVYAMLPPLAQQTPDLPQQVFPPATGFLVGLLLFFLYGATGRGLMKMRNVARMVSVFLALFGIVGGVFGVLGAFIGGVNSFAPDWLKLGALGLTGLCAYFLIAIFDVAVLVFLLNGRVRAAFYGEIAIPDPEPVIVSSKLSRAPITEDAPASAQEPANAPIT